MEERVGFYIPRESADGMGGTEDGWQKKFEAFAHFRYLRGGETVLAARLSGVQPIVATIETCRDAREVTTDWHMRDMQNGTVYNIRSIVPSDDKAWIELTCESGVAA